MLGDLPDEPLLGGFGLPRGLGYVFRGSLVPLALVVPVPLLGLELPPPLPVGLAGFDPLPELAGFELPLLLGVAGLVPPLLDGVAGFDPPLLVGLAGFDPPLPVGVAGFDPAPALLVVPAPAGGLVDLGGPGGGGLALIGGGGLIG